MVGCFIAQLRRRLAKSYNCSVETFPEKKGFSCFEVLILSESTNKSATFINFASLTKPSLIQTQNSVIL